MAEILKLTSNPTEATELFRMILENSETAIWDWDLASDTIRWSDGYKAIFGEGDGRRPVVHQDDETRVRDAIERARSGAGSWVVEYRSRKPAGDYIQVREKGRIIRDSAGNPVRMIGIINDVSEKIVAQNKLSSLGLLISDSQQSIITCDDKLHITTWNNSAALLYGATVHDMIGRKYEFFTDGSSSDGAAILEALTNQGFWCGERRRVNQSGSVIVTECRYTRTPGKGHRQTYIFVETDVTKLRQMEGEVLLARSKTHTGRKYLHDISNSLSPVVTGLSVASFMSEDPKIKEMLGTSGEQLEHGLQLVGELMSIMQSDQMPDHAEK